jgi:hypothetical protein
MAIPPTSKPSPERKRREGLRAAVVAAILGASAAVGWWWGQPSSPVEAPGTQAGAPLKSAPHLPRFATYGAEHPSDGVRHVADWALDSGDAGGRAIVVVDKQQARVWLFDPQGTLVAQTPALLGSAVGDDPVPGIGEKPLSEIRPEEKTTPAGRFVAEHGVNSHGEDIVWVSYDLAVSMHRVRPTVKAERRLERLASDTAEDNRISFGCINLPVAFYEQALLPAVRDSGATVYVLPETRSPQQQFGSYDVAARWRGTRTAPA